MFIDSYKSRQHCFHLHRLHILILLYFYSVSLSAYESMVQIGNELEPLNPEPLNVYMEYSITPALYLSISALTPLEVF